MSYSKIHEDSQETVAAQLDYFQTPNTKTSILDGTDIEISPVFDSDGSTVEFDFQGSQTNYIDLAETRLHVQARVTTSTGAALSNTLADVTVMPVTNFLHSLFGILSVALGPHNIQHENNYPYVSYLEHLLMYGERFQKTLGRCHLWFSDKTGVVDTAAITTGMADDINDRKAIISGSKTVDLVGRLNCSFFNQGKLLPPNTRLRVSLQRSDTKFCLIETAAGDTVDYKI